jgi:hypothetical protein
MYQRLGVLARGEVPLRTVTSLRTSVIAAVRALS